MQSLRKLFRQNVLVLGLVCLTSAAASAAPDDVSLDMKAQPTVEVPHETAPSVDEVATGPKQKAAVGTKAETKNKPTQSGSKARVELKGAATSVVGPTPEQIAKWNAPITGIHPLKRLMRPVWRLRQDAQHLEDKIDLLYKPMSKLEPDVEALQTSLSSVDSNMSAMNTSIPALNEHISGVRTRLNELRTDLHEVMGVRSDLKEISKVNGQLKGLQNDLGQLKYSMSELKSPLTELPKPLGAAHEKLNIIDQKIANTTTLLDALGTKVETMTEQMKDLKASIHGLHEPMGLVSSPLVEVHKELKQLNGMLLAVECTALVLGGLGIVAIIALLMRMRTSR